MPEIWLNYGSTEVVLEIMAENLEQTIDSGRGALGPEKIIEKLDAIDVSKPFDLVLMHDSQAVRQTVSTLFSLCERRSAPLPGILADRDVMSSVKAGLPEGSVIGEFAAKADGGHLVHGSNNNDDIEDSQGRSLVFVAEAEFDGLFGYKTVATRLIKRFGSEAMLAAYAKRDGNLPSPGRRSGSLIEATKFADTFEIRGIEAVAGSAGITDIFVGHPSDTTAKASALLESVSIKDIEQAQKTMITSTGKAASNTTLDDALSSLWNCHGAIRNNGLCILVAECARGLGPDAVRMHVEGRLPEERLRNPSEYISGMENLLFLSEVRQKCQIALVSILPEIYMRRLGMIPLAGMKSSVEYILRTQGVRQKVTVIKDGARLLLR